MRVKRELEDGWFQWVRMPLPALLTIQSGISKLRYATLMGIKKAKTKEVRRIDAGRTSGVRDRPPSRSHRVYLPHRKKETQIITGTPAEAAAKLADILKFEVRVHMNGVLVILEYRRRRGTGCPGRRWPPDRKWRRKSHQPLMAAVAGSELDELAAELAGKQLARAYRRAACAAAASTRPTDSRSRSSS